MPVNLDLHRELFAGGSNDRLSIDFAISYVAVGFFATLLKH
jgi:hypothetical protein